MNGQNNSQIVDPVIDPTVVDPNQSQDVAAGQSQDCPTRWQFIKANWTVIIAIVFLVFGASLALYTIFHKREPVANVEVQKPAVEAEIQKPTVEKKLYGKQSESLGITQEKQDQIMIEMISKAEGFLVADHLCKAIDEASGARMLVNQDTPENLKKTALDTILKIKSALDQRRLLEKGFSC